MQNSPGLILHQLLLGAQLEAIQAQKTKKDWNNTELTAFLLTMEKLLWSRKTVPEKVISSLDSSWTTA